MKKKIIWILLTVFVETPLFAATVPSAINVVPQAGAITSGTAGNAVFAVITTGITTGATGRVDW